MISKHCGVRLRHVAGKHGLTKKHWWVCVRCIAVFVQRTRQPKEQGK